jgi:hypothetical protein
MFVETLQIVVVLIFAVATPLLSLIDLTFVVFCALLNDSMKNNQGVANPSGGGVC